MIYRNLAVACKLFCWIYDNSIHWLGICLGVLVACHSSPDAFILHPTPFQIRLENNTVCKEYAGGFDGVLENHSNDTIELLGLCYISFFDMRTVGWVEYDLVRARSADAHCYDSIAIAPGETWELTPVQSQLRGCGTYMLQIPYKIQSTAGIEDNVYHIYSNSVSIGTAQMNITSSHEIHWHLPMPHITFVNKNGSGSDWIIPPCAKEINEWAATLDVPGKYLHATLERATAWGTWESILPTMETCTVDSSLIEIPPQRTQFVNLWLGGTFDISPLEPGLYRWHMIYYGTKPSIGKLSAIYHNFSPVFEIQQ